MADRRWRFSLLQLFACMTAIAVAAAYGKTSYDLFRSNPDSSGWLFLGCVALVGAGVGVLFRRPFYGLLAGFLLGIVLVWLLFVRW